MLRSTLAIRSSFQPEARSLTEGLARPREPAWRRHVACTQDDQNVARDELAALREEFERMATVLLDAGVPDLPPEALPWAAEDADCEPDVLPFAPLARAA